MPEEEKRSKLVWFLAVSTCLNFFLLLVVLWALSGLSKDLTNNKVIASVATSYEDEEFIGQVCRDLGIESEIVVIIGPYYLRNFFNTSLNYQMSRLLSDYPTLADPTDPTRRILMKESIYLELTPEEKQAILAHEIWHIYSLIQEGPLAILGVGGDVDADNFATKYIHPDVLIGLLLKYGDPNSPNVKARIRNLEERKVIQIQ